MYRGFELKNLGMDFFNGKYQSFYEAGLEIYNSQKQEFQETLEKFENDDGSLDGDKMQSNWFPQIKADVFLSHSHKDEKLVIAFSGWLKKNFTLNVFIDSCIWGHSLKLQKLIDDELSRGKDKKLNYNKVIHAANHVHMMLNTALMQMINNCECVIFVNTPNSVRPNDVVDKVVSPWLYSEIAMTKLIKNKNVKEHRTLKLYECFTEKAIQYNLDTDHLTQITSGTLNKWYKHYSADEIEYPLDTLYKIKPLDRA